MFDQSNYLVLGELSPVVAAQATVEVLSVGLESIAADR